jgi:hypothetical protein
MINLNFVSLIMRTYLFLMFFFSLFTLSAQVNNSLKPATPKMLLQVKQLNQFFERFNYQKDFNDRKIDSAFAGKVSRADYLKLLFDAEDKRLTDKLPVADKYQKLREGFIKQVCDEANPAFLHRQSNNIYAEAFCEVLYRGKPQNITLIFQNKHLPNDALKWEIVGIRENLLLFDTARNLSYYIPPNSQETNFLSLIKLFENRRQVTQLASDDFRIDKLTLFFTLLREGLITFKYAKEVRYSLLEIPGWIIELQDFQRNSLNSGWLISNLLPADETDKQIYLQKIGIERK